MELQKKIGAPAHLLVPAVGRPHALQVGRTFTIGRMAEASLRIGVPSVSRLHAEIVWRDGRPTLVDRSSYGTSVNGRPITEHALEPDDVIEIGSYRWTYCVGEISRSCTPTPDSATVDGQCGTLSGVIGDAGLCEHLQSLELNGRTGMLVVFGLGPGRRAWIALRGGRPLAAEAEGFVDEDAVLHLLTLRKGRFVFTAEPPTVAPRMRASMTALLFEASRRADEATRVAGEAR